MNLMTIIFVVFIVPCLSQNDDILDGNAASPTHGLLQVLTTDPQRDTQSGKVSMKTDDPFRQLTVERIFLAEEFQEEKLGGITWSKLGAAYFTLKGSKATGEGQVLVRIDAASGAEEVVVRASALIPPGESNPLSVDGFAFSANEFVRRQLSFRFSDN